MIVLFYCNMRCLYWTYMMTSDMFVSDIKTLKYPWTIIRVIWDEYVMNQSQIQWQLIPQRPFQDTLWGISFFVFVNFKLSVLVNCT